MTGEKGQWWGDERETAELIWCAAHLHRIIAPPSPKDLEPEDNLRPPDGESPARKPLEDRPQPTSPQTEQIESPALIAADPKNSEPPPPNPEKTESLSTDRALPVRVPDPFPLPKPAAISKMLLPLSKRVPGILANELDIDATVEQTAEANGLPTIAFRYPLERWFEVHLLIDRSPSMAFWGDLAEGVATLFRWQGFFRDVRVWQFETLNSEPRLFSGAERIERDIRSLIAPGRNQLFIVLTDTLAKAWRSGKAFAALAILGEQHPVTIAHVFPQSLWRRTALHQAIQRPLVAPHSGCANSMLKVGARLHTTADLYQFPIFNLSPNHFATWANFLAGSGGNSIQGVLIRQELPTNVDSDQYEEDQPKQNQPKQETSEDLLREFLADASPKARELAKVLAAVPLIPPVMRLAQRQFLPNSEHWHLAEVFFSGLVQKSSFGPKQVTVPETWYEFKPGIRDLLLENSSVSHTAEIWRSIGDFIEHHYGSIRDFPAVIPNPEGSIQDTAVNRELYFAEVDGAIFKTWGGKYAALAQELRDQVAAGKWQIELQIEGFPPIQTFEFQVKTITIEDEDGEIEASTFNLQSFQFEVATITGINKYNTSNTINYVEIVENLVFSHTQKHLNEVERLIIDSTISNQTYDKMAASSNYTTSHLKDVASKLWQVLSAALGKKVNKTNLKNVIQRQVNYSQIEIHRSLHQAQYFIENLGNDVQLEMVLIPEGSFLMGSPENEPERYSYESPQHQVTVPTFFIGKYAVTQAQWKAVAALPQVNRELNPDPSNFKGASRPVETVSWYDAVEFCSRLSQHTGKSYRLPSEAEWEYACRAGTTTPFHFGETITSELANYNANYTYGAGVKGTYQQETTVVGSFGVANAFGLYDMHGNVWEWCLDDWHSNYEGAPEDGSAWFDDMVTERSRSNDNLYQKQGRAVLRGGSWFSFPEDCRSASRNYDVRAERVDDLDNFGFRVVCAFGGILR